MLAPDTALTDHLRASPRPKLQRGVACGEIRAVGDPADRTLRFIMSTEGVKRDGNVVRNDGWTNLKEFVRDNPALLWCHKDRELPLGHWTNVFTETVRADWYEGTALVGDAKFATREEYELADTVYRLYLGRHMRAVSIRWVPTEDGYRPLRDADGHQVGWDFFRNELIECSAVPVPADPQALMVATQRGLITSDQLEQFVRWTDVPPAEPSDVYVLDSRPGRAADPEDATPAAVPPAGTSDEAASGAGAATPAPTIDDARAWAEVAHGIEAVALSLGRGQVATAAMIACDRISGAMRVAADLHEQLRWQLMGVEYAEDSNGEADGAFCGSCVERLTAALSDAVDGVADVAAALGLVGPDATLYEAPDDGGEAAADDEWLRAMPKSKKRKLAFAVDRCNDAKLRCGQAMTVIREVLEDAADGKIDGKVEEPARAEPVVEPAPVVVELDPALARRLRRAAGAETLEDRMARVIPEPVKPEPAPPPVDPAPRAAAYFDDKLLARLAKLTG